MAQSLSSMRIIRLNRLLGLLREKPHIGPDVLMAKCPYPSIKAIQQDIRFLRRAFKAKIAYSRHAHGYRLEDTGDFLLLLKPEHEALSSL